MPDADQTTHPVQPEPTGLSWASLSTAVAPVQWDWPGWLPAGFLTVLAGEPGSGKSILCLHLAATYLAARQWPDGTPFIAHPGQVVWCESESSHALNLERARRWNLDLSRILTPLDSPFHNFSLDHPDHYHALLALARRDAVRLVVLDSLRGLRTSATRRTPIGDIVTFLADLARIAGKPVLLTHHLRKPTRRDTGARPTSDRLLGASAIAQAARVIWTLDAPDPANPDHHRLSVIKNNLAPLPAPLGMHIAGPGLRFGPPPQLVATPSELDRAADFLQQLLAPGPLPFHQIRAAHLAAGFSERTIRRAKQQLAISSIRPAGQAEWYWRLPAEKG
jgi:putative DNA primase/helicase